MKQTKKQTWWKRAALGGAVAMGLTLGSTAWAAAPDAWVTTKIKLTLLTTEGLSANDVNVDTIDGHVTLHGTVASEQEKARAEQTARSGARWLVDSYLDPKHEQVGLAGASFLSLGGDPIERYLDGVVVWGTPGEVLDELLRLREEMFLDYLLCAPLSHRTFTLFTEKVLPRLF